MLNRSYGLLPCLLLTCSTLVLADGPSPPVSTAPATAPSAPTSLVHKGNLELVADAQGYLQPIDPYEVRLRPKSYSGDLTINSIAANGVKVKKGQILLAIDPEPLKKQLAAAENALTAEQANVAKAEADAKLAEQIDALALKQQQHALKEAQDTVTWWEKVDGPQMLESNELAVKQARDVVNDDQDELDQLKKMYKTEELTNATADIVVKRSLRGLEQAKINLAMTEARAEKTRTFHYPVARQRVQDALIGSEYALQQLQIAQAQAKIGRATGLVATHAAYDAAVEKVSDLKADLDKLTVPAPEDGIVAYGAFNSGSFQYDPRALHSGEKATPGSILISLLVPGKLRAVVDLPEAKFENLKAGDKAVLTPLAFPESRIEGTCDDGPRAATASQAGPVYALSITLAAVDPRLLAGNKVNVHIQEPMVRDVLLIPASAVGNGNVWVKRGDGATEERKVTTGRTDGKMVEVVDGVKEGEEILTQAKS